MARSRIVAAGVALGALVIVAVSFAALRPDSFTDRWHVVTVRGDAAFLCTADAVGDSTPPSCSAAPGTTHNLPLSGDLVEELMSTLPPNRSEVIVSATRTDTGWELNDFEL